MDLFWHVNIYQLQHLAMEADCKIQSFLFREVRTQFKMLKTLGSFNGDAIGLFLYSNQTLQ